MPRFAFDELSQSTRVYMLQELDLDEAASGPYMSSRFTSEGREQYAALLRSALTDGSPETLYEALNERGILEVSETLASGLIKKVPSNAAQLLADSEFNRYYVRGVCRAASDGDDDAEVEVYRARVSSKPRPESEDLVGSTVSAKQLLDLLRKAVADPSIAIPQVGSGLSVRRTPKLSNS